MDIALLETIADLVRAILPYFISFMMALFFHYFVERLKRPALDIRLHEDEDKFNPQFDLHYLHVRVVNKKNRLVNRNPAIDCESEVYVIDSKSGKLKEGSPFSTKWARQTTLVTIPTETGMAIKYLPINPPVERRVNIYPGQMDGGREGLQLDIIKKEKGRPYCWIHDPQLYVEPNKEKWKLNKGKYYIVIKVRYAGGSSKPIYFLLENESEDPSYVKLKKCSEQERRSLNLFGQIDL